jgi:hypothetical protein
MSRTRFSIATVVLVSAVAAFAYQAAPGPVSAAMRARVKNEQFQVVTSVRGLPLGVRDALQTLFGSQDLDIAEPGAQFQSTDAISNLTLPTRRLVTAGCSANYCLVYYERGGIARSFRVALFHWTPAATRFEGGGTAAGGLRTVDDVRNAVVSGSLQNPTKVW